MAWAGSGPQTDETEEKKPRQKLSLLNKEIVIERDAAIKPSSRCGWTTWSIAAKANGIARAHKAGDEDTIELIYEEAIEYANVLRQEADATSSGDKCIDAQAVLVKFAGKIAFVSTTLEPFRIVEFNPSSRSAADRKKAISAYYSNSYDAAGQSVSPAVLEKTFERIVVGNFIICATKQCSFVGIKLENDLWLYCDNDISHVAEYSTEVFIDHFMVDYAATILSDTPVYSSVIFAIGIAKDLE
jgi:hypothetical protein